MKLNNCNCEFEELKNSVEDSTAKSYILISECDNCKTKREANAIESAKQQRKQEIITELNELDKKVIRPLLDGETERVDEIKAQKVTLRTELQSL
jgi:hypothetical protein